jgi:hypothetical protein
MPFVQPGPGAVCPDARRIELARRRLLIYTCIGLLPPTESSVALPSENSRALSPSHMNEKQVRLYICIRTQNKADVCRCIAAAYFLHSSFP